MISVKTVVVCDGCGLAGVVQGDYRVPVLRSELEEVRDDARRRGWSSYRITQTSPFGDYCPKCQAAHERAKAQKAAAKKGGHKR